MAQFIRRMSFANVDRLRLDSFRHSSALFMTSFAGGAAGAAGLGAFIDMYPSVFPTAGCSTSAEARESASDAGASQRPDVFDRGFRIERSYSCQGPDASGHTRCEALSQILRGQGAEYDTTVCLCRSAKL